MKKQWICLGVGLALALTACNEEKKLPPKPVKLPKPAPKVVEDEEPKLVPLEEELNQPVETTNSAKVVAPDPVATSTSPITSLSNGPTPTPNTSGDYVLQVGTSSNDKDAEFLMKRIKKLGYKAYTVEVYNPGELQGRFIRVRLGFFNNVPDARQFGHNVLKPEGISFWIDNKGNDNNSGSNQAVNYEEETPAPAPAPEAPKAVKEVNTDYQEPVQSADVVEDEWGQPTEPETPAAETTPEPEAPAVEPAVAEESAEAPVEPAPEAAAPEAPAPASETQPETTGWDTPAAEPAKKKATTWDDAEGWE